MKRLIGFAVLVVSLLFAGQGFAAFSSLFVVGDSLSDSGNVAILQGGANAAPNWDLVPSQSYAPSNTFTNGPVWVETFAANFGLSAVASLTPGGGTNGAVGGARSGERQSILEPFYGIDQANAWVNFFGTLDSDSLWVVWVGGNDIRDAVRNTDASSASQQVNDAVANVGTIINILENAGAQNFLIPNVSDIGIVPEASLAGTYVQDGTALTMQFNAGLATQIDNLRNTLGVNIIELDVFSAFQATVNDPGAFGFSNVTDPCLEIGGAGVCSDPDSYAFWDGIHPTAAIHAGTAALATAAVVPVPAAFPLLLSALAGFGLWRRKS